MSRYEVAFDVVEHWRGWFEAESDEEAARIYNDLLNGDADLTELPGYEERNYGIQTDYNNYGLRDDTGNYVNTEESN